MLLGVAGVFVAVLVTASMIPQTFEAGSVDLLLSKPISRSWLFLAKFVGGCAFIAINAAYFIGGLWLMLGLRFGLWNQRLLWAIPLYLFLFAIYYSVSALAGIVWRNAIVSVVMAVVFWFVCWTLGTANTLVESISLNPRRIDHDRAGRRRPDRRQSRRRLSLGRLARRLATGICGPRRQSDAVHVSLAPGGPDLRRRGRTNPGVSSGLSGISATGRQSPADRQAEPTTGAAARE